MKCSICKNDYPNIHEIKHGNEIHFMCSKSWNDMLADLDPTVDAMILPDFCPDEDAQRA